MLLLAGAAAAAAGEYWRLPVPAAGVPEAGTPEVIADLEPDTCALCHPAQAADWRESLHAHAFSPGLTGQLGLFEPSERSDCLSCHLPREDQRRGAADHTPHGVDCAACHVRGHTRHGPQKVADTPHGVVQEEPLFGDSRFCAACHQFDESGLSLNGKPLENTYEEWRASRYAAEGITCQGCHMPEGRHLFRGIHDAQTTARGLAVSAVRTATGIRLTAGNAGAGHHLPTYATPRILLRLRGDRDSGSAEHVIGRVLAWDEAGLEERSDTRLAAGERVEVFLSLPPEHGGSVAVDVQPDADYTERIYPGLIEWFGEELGPEGRGQLAAAQRQGCANAYRLYQLRCDPWSGRETPCASAR